MIEKLDSPFIAKHKVKINLSKGDERIKVLETVIMEYHAACTQLEQENMKLKKNQERILKENKKLARAGKMLKLNRDELDGKLREANNPKGLEFK